MSSAESTERVIDVEVQVDSQKTDSGAPTGGSQADGATGNAENIGDEIVHELGRLGNRVVDLIKTAWASDERQRIQEDLEAGLSSMASNLEEGLKKMGEREKTKEFIDKAEEVAESVTEKVKSSPVANNLADGLVQGLRTVSEQLENLSHELNSRTNEKAETEAKAEEDIPVRKEG